jgi:hypothetical protein
MNNPLHKKGFLRKHASSGRVRVSEAVIDSWPRRNHLVPRFAGFGKGGQGETLLQKGCLLAVRFLKVIK